MDGFNLNMGDPVMLVDVALKGEGSARTGTGYKVTQITEKYVECTHDSLDFGDSFKSMYYGKNDLHLIKKD